MIKKLIFWTFLTLLLVISCTAGYIYSYRASLLSDLLSDVLEVPASVSAIEFSKQGIIIRDLHIQNPPNCTLKDALTVKTITATFDWNELYKTILGIRKKITITSFILDTSNMDIELFSVTGSDTNWSRLLGSMATPQDDSPAIEFQINKLLLTNIMLQVKYHIGISGSVKTAPISQVEIDNIGGEGGINTKQLFSVIFKVLLEQAASQLNLKTLLPDMILQRLVPIPIFEVEQVKDFFEGLFQPTTDNNN